MLTPPAEFDTLGAMPIASSQNNELIRCSHPGRHAVSLPTVRYRRKPAVVLGRKHIGLEREIKLERRICRSPYRCIDGCTGRDLDGQPKRFVSMLDRIHRVVNGQMNIGQIEGHTVGIVRRDGRVSDDGRLHRDVVPIGDGILRGRQARHIPERANIGEALVSDAERGDRILIMGARDDTLIDFARDLVERLGSSS